MSGLSVYLLVKADTFRDASLVIGCLGVIIVGVLYGAAASGDFDFGIKEIPWAKFLLIFFVICIVFGILIPTTNEMAAILVIPAIATEGNIKILKKIPPKILKMIGLSLNKLNDILDDKSVKTNK